VIIESDIFNTLYCQYLLLICLSIGLLQVTASDSECFVFIYGFRSSVIPLSAICMFWHKSCVSK